MTFYTRRARDTKQEKEDALVDFDTDILMSYAFKQGGGGFGKHAVGDRGYWSIRISETGNLEDADIDLFQYLR